MFGNPPTPLQLAAVALTHPGLVRKSNEDRVFEMVTNSSEREPIGVFAVCDGVGGHLAGEAASHLAVEAMRASLNVLFAPSDPRATLLLPETVVMQTGTSDPQPSSGTQITQKLVEAVRFANSVVHNYSRQKPAEAGNASATVTAALVRGRLAVGANVGDSRTYMLRGDELTQVSRDHSMVAYLVTLGQIKPEDVYTHPQRNQIYRSLGTHPDVEVDTWRFLLEPGDMLLLCSDGLWEMIHDPGEIASLMRSSPDLAEAGQRLIDAANRYGGEDNIGIVLARLEGN